jgi:23S rRNA (cytidine1920-2'-O)/16S rRNA (cytidine1409-2'-O)-methyltransferase
MTKVPKKRLDLLMVERGLAESRQQAQRLIMAGKVLVNDHLVDKPGTRVPVAADLRAGSTPPYVSRGGLKLEAALDAFGIGVQGRVAADVGASTGGFTDCLLQRGAARVYAIDVGYGQLAWKLQQDPRVIVIDRTNARHLEALPEPVDLVTADVSFISLKLVLPAAMGWLAAGGQIVALIKPQFEAGPQNVGKGGVVRDPAVHHQVLADITRWADEQGLGLQGLIRSPITGPAGNVEFLAHWALNARAGVPIDTQIDACLKPE